MTRQRTPASSTKRLLGASILPHRSLKLCSCPWPMARMLSTRPSPRRKLDSRWLPGISPPYPLTLHRVLYPYTRYGVCGIALGGESSRINPSMAYMRQQFTEAASAHF